MRIPCFIAFLLLATACNRSAPPDLSGAPVVAPSTGVAAPVAADPSPEAKPAKAAPSGKSVSGKRKSAPRPTPAATARDDDGRAIADDPCVGLDGVELDECLGFDAADRGVGNEAEDDQASRDFVVEQQRRDRELLERDADEAAARERDREWEDAPVRDEDLPAEDGYDPYPPPEDDYSEPPPDDDSGW